MVIKTRGFEKVYGIFLCKGLLELSLRSPASKD